MPAPVRSTRKVLPYGKVASSSVDRAWREAWPFVTVDPLAATRPSRPTNKRVVKGAAELGMCSTARSTEGEGSQAASVIWSPSATIPFNSTA